jgi:hypothetical protein
VVAVAHELPAGCDNVRDGGVDVSMVDEAGDDWMAGDLAGKGSRRSGRDRAEQTRSLAPWTYVPGGRSASRELS